MTTDPSSLAAMLVALLNCGLVTAAVAATGLGAARLVRTRSLPLEHHVLLSALLLVLSAPAIVVASGMLEWGWSPTEWQQASGAQDADRAASPVGNAQQTVRAPAFAPELQPVFPAMQSSGDVDAQGGPPEDTPFPSFIAPSETAWLSVPAGPVEEAEGPTASTISGRDGESLPLLPRGGLVAALVWIVGTLLGMVRLLWGAWLVCRLHRRLAQSDDPRLAELMSRAARQVALPRIPNVRLATHSPVPFTLGVFRPWIVLPRSLATELSDEMLVGILIHEAAHVRRRDNLVGLLQRLAAVLYWWNPLLHWINTRLADLREQLCDNHVLAARINDRRYARVLLDLASRTTSPDALPVMVGLVKAPSSGLSARISRLLKEERDMNTIVNRRWKLGALVATLCTVGVAMSLTIRAESPPTTFEPVTKERAVSTQPTAATSSSEDEGRSAAVGPIVAEGTVAAEPSESERETARRLLVRAREQLNSGDYEAARRSARAAARWGADYEIFEDRPELVLEDLRKHVQQASPVTEPPASPANPQATSAGTRTTDVTQEPPTHVTSQGVPILSEVPFVGRVFQSNEAARNGMSQGLTLVLLTANEDGSLRQLHHLTAPLGNEAAAYEKLSTRIADWAAEYADAKDRQLAVQIMADPQLKHEHVLRAVEACAGLVDQVTLASPTTQRELKLNIGFVRDRAGNKRIETPVVFWDDQLVRVSEAWPRLQQEMLRFQTAPSSAQDVTVILRADPETPADVVQQVIRQAQQAGFERFALRAVDAADEATAVAPGVTPEVQLHFTEPAGLEIALSSPQGKLARLTAPARFGVSAGQTYGLSLSVIRLGSDLTILGTLDVPAVTSRTRAFVSHNAVRIELTAEDVDQVKSNNLVTKVVYLPDAELGELATVGVETLVSTRLDQSVDPVAEADRRGAILAIIRLGDRTHSAKMGATKTYPVEASRDIVARVLGVQNSQDGESTVLISCGSDDGIAAGQELCIYRSHSPGERSLQAGIELQRVEAHRAWGRVVFPGKKKTPDIRVGDDVVEPE